MKTCRACGASKPVDDFGVHRSAPDGRSRVCKPCAAAWQREYRKSHPERKRAAGKKYYEAHKAETLEASRRWKSENRERARELNRQSEERRKEHIRARTAIYRKTPEFRAKRAVWYQQHKDERRAYFAAWREANKDRVRSYYRRAYEKLKKLETYFFAKAQKRKALKLAATIQKFTPAQLRERMSVYGFRCAYCGGPFQHIDHVKPLSRGGPHCLSNLRPACRTCNVRKHNIPLAEWRARSR